MSDATPVKTDLASLVQRTEQLFESRYGRPARWTVAAPGRVNLIGEHIDYNDGFVLPMAIDRHVVISADLAEPSANETRTELAVARVYSITIDQHHTIPLEKDSPSPSPLWTKYLWGVIQQFRSQQICPASFDAVIDSTVPSGSGLSSSAALEVATATLLEAIGDRTVTPEQKALLCQTAEHVAVGMPCGIMDQLSSTMGQRDHLMLIDCRTLKVEMIPLTDSGLSVLIVNSNIKHELASGEYARRRSTCEAAKLALGISTFRELTLHQLEKVNHLLDDIQFRRVRHVVTEIQRTKDTAEAITAGRWDDVGALMYASHASLRDDYQVSCTELDLLVKLARRVGSHGGMIGARMTGGGFGGCMVALVRTGRLSDIARRIAREYRRATGIEPAYFATRPENGALVMRSD